MDLEAVLRQLLHLLVALVGDVPIKEYDGHDSITIYCVINGVNFRGTV
jgi:hypothetical protein